MTEADIIKHLNAVFNRGKKKLTRKQIYQQMLAQLGEATL